MAVRRVLRWLLGSRKAATWLTLGVAVNAVAFGLMGFISGVSEDSEGADFTLYLGIVTENNHRDDRPVPLVQISQEAGNYYFFVAVPLYTGDFPTLIVSGIHPTDCGVPYADAGYVKITPIEIPFHEPLPGEKIFVRKTPVNLSRVEFTEEATRDYASRPKIPLKCMIGVTSHHDTFVDRRIAVANITDPASPTSAGYRYNFIEYNVDFSDLRSKEGLRVWGGWPPATQGYDGSEKQRVTDQSMIRQALTGEPVTASWRDADAAARRDFLLIVSGTIFGLGGAFFVEWIKARLEPG